MIGVFSCQEEDDSFIKQEHTPQTSKTKYSITKIDYQTVQQNNRLVNSITKIKEQTGTKGSSTQNRLVHSSTYNFYIDTDVATYMENANGSYHSYTFPVIRDNPTVALENILFSLQADGTYKVSLVSYNLTENEKEDLLNGQFVDLTNKIFKENINGEDLSNVVFNKEIQTTFTTSNICACAPNHPAGIDPNTNAPCSCFAILITITGTNEGIEDEGEEDIHNNNDIQEEENNSGGGVPDNPTTTEEEATTPVVTIPYAQNLIECLGLNSAENANLVVSNWISNLDNFFQMREASNHCNADNQDFVIEAIEAMLNGEVETFQEFVDKEICIKIAAQVADPDFDAKVQTINNSSAFNASEESGYSQNQDGSFNTLSPINNGHSLDIPYVPGMLGFLHAHTNSYEVPDKDGDGVPEVVIPIKMPSPGDIVKFLQIVMEAGSYNIPTSDTYGSMYSSSGNYTLKFTGNVSGINASYTSLVNKLNNKTLDTKFKQYFKDYYNKEKALLHFIKNEIGVDGIRLYKINNNGTVKEKKLNSNGNVNSETC